MFHGRQNVMLLSTDRLHPSACFFLKASDGLPADPGDAHIFLFCGQSCNSIAMSAVNVHKR